MALPPAPITARVRFKRRPHHALHGSEWIPHGIEYRPFFPGDRDAPPVHDADERAFACSNTLESHLRDFSSLRVPTILSLDSSPDLCDVYTRSRTAAEGISIDNVIRFMTSTWYNLVVCYEKEDERVDAADREFATGDWTAVRGFIHTDLLSMDPVFIEFKTWACLLEDVVEFGSSRISMAVAGDEYVDEYVDAIACLDDLTTIHTDNKLTRIRAKLLHDDAISDDVVWALEVRGIAKAVFKRFCSTPHQFNAYEAAYDAGMLRIDVAGGRWPDHRTDYWLDWVPVRDRASADTHTRLCPATAYLQLILCHTPMKEWAAAFIDVDPDPDASPLGFAWALARRSPWVEARTAGVAVLVTMGRHVHRLMAYEPKRAEEKRLAAEYHFEKVLYREGFWAALGGGVKAGFMSAAKRLQPSPSPFENYRRGLEVDDAKELLTEIQGAAERLGKAGERYAQLLAEKDGPRDRELEDVVVSIRTLAGFILGKAEPPVPRTVLLTVDGLATGES
ncbi:hypothetical protein GGX14DRAFT_694602 [Mycena pura]|uniref:Uncharacterized protein n=1 Tax=Mycena pura TaxID=153505 RepID=A0AAD6YL29_9AGAR|nr:hypothetical protein GGX14DRAFT_694602 [Mycena pura]